MRGYIAYSPDSGAVSLILKRPVYKHCHPGYGGLRGRRRIAQGLRSGG